MKIWSYVVFMLILIFLGLAFFIIFDENPSPGEDWDYKGDFLKCEQFRRDDVALLFSREFHCKIRVADFRKDISICNGFEDDGIDDGIDDGFGIDVCKSFVLNDHALCSKFLGGNVCSAVLEQNVGTCEGMGDDFGKFQCISLVALRMDDSQICWSLKDIESREACLKLFLES